MLDLQNAGMIEDQNPRWTYVMTQCTQGFNDTVTLLHDYCIIVFTSMPLNMSSNSFYYGFTFTRTDLSDFPTLLCSTTTSMYVAKQTLAIFTNTCILFINISDMTQKEDANRKS